MNKVILSGHAGRDAEIRTLDNGTPVARVSLATNDGYKSKSGEWIEKTNWHTLIFWRGAAERAAETITKGTKLLIEGKIENRSWTDKEGNERQTTEVVVNYFEYLNRVPDIPSSDQQEAEPVTTPATTAEGDLGPDDDLPF